MVKSQAVQRAGSSAIRELLELTEQPGIISMAGGLPNPQTFPVEAIGAAMDAVRTNDRAAALQYGPTEGYRPLRDWVVQALDPHGPLTINNVQITNGAQQALDLTIRALVDPGRTVAVGEATYVGALQALRAAGVTLATIPTDEEGLRVDVLAEQLADGLAITAVYVVSNFDNPTGSTLSGPRRLALAKLADQFDFWIIDDDPYGALRWAGDAPTPLRCSSDRVITVGTTSKVLCPGLRVGWVLAPTEVRAAVTQLKQASDLHTSSLDQRIVTHLLTTPGLLDLQVRQASNLYEAQCQALVDALHHHFRGALRFSMPEGGLFLWAHFAEDLAPGRSAADLLEVALRHGVAYVPGDAFVAHPTTPSRHLRLSFATAAPESLAEGAARLAAALEQLCADEAQ